MNNILIDKTEKIATITINRPRKLNALNKATIQELHNAFTTLETDENIRVIILTGCGDKAFVAGADISEFVDFDVSQATVLSKRGQELLFDFIENLKTPVIAAINGFALGGGLELAMSCHFRVASNNAKMGLPEVSLGVIPGYGGTQRLPQLVGKGKAMELIMSASMLNAEEAKNYGLVNYVVSQEELLPLCKKLAIKISKNSSTAISAAINAINANFDSSKNGYAIEIEQFGKCFESKDFTEGTTAFLEKRKPNFK
ncbi:MAG: enoyl-CoA hydratase-related protein [Flavobacteriaceae bacterium]|nr:enoyl-CoA hydratase-related protein [Flavobacteriaceae bacterium]